MRRVWGFLSDPSLHLMVIALVLIVLTIGSPGSPESDRAPALAFCSKCGVKHYLEAGAPCKSHVRLAQVRP